MIHLLASFLVITLTLPALAQVNCGDVIHQVGNRVESSLKDVTPGRVTVASAYIDGLTAWKNYQTKQISTRAKTVDTFLNTMVPNEMDPDQADSTNGVASAIYDDIRVLSAALRVLADHPTPKTRKHEQLLGLAREFSLHTSRTFFLRLEEAYLADDGTGSKLIEFIAKNFGEYERWLDNGLKHLVSEQERLNKVYINPNSNTTDGKYFATKFGRANLSGDRWRVVNDVADVTMQSAEATKNLSFGLTNLITALAYVSVATKDCRINKDFFDRMDAMALVQKELSTAAENKH